MPQGGKPVSCSTPTATTPLQITLVLVGTVSNYGKEGFGPRLDVTIPLIAGGPGAITDFNVKIHKMLALQGRETKLRLRQMPGSKKLKARGAFTYATAKP